MASKSPAQMPKGSSILVVDDVAATCESLRLDLEEAGYRVTCRSNGAEAMSALESQPFDALVTDLWMPKMDGLVLIKEVHNVQPGIRVFVITGGGPKLPIESATTLAQIWGAEQIFVKPFDNRDIVSALARAA